MTLSGDSMSLSDLIDDQPLDAVVRGLRITGMQLDSRQVKAGDAFVALQGGSEHGIRFASQAERRGATVVLADGLAAIPELSIPVLVIPELRSKLGAMAATLFGQPAEKIRLLGVTGTNGKTSVAWFIAQLLNQSHGCGFIGTIGVGKTDDALLEQDRTTPDVISLHQTLSELSGQGCKAVAMEVSSHALDQGRVDGLSFEVGVFTNLSHDHLDYHGSMAAYAKAKKKLFTDYGVRHAVLNIDDPIATEWQAELEQHTQVIPYGLTQRKGISGVFARETSLSPDGIQMLVETPIGELEITSSLIGEFNASNLLAAIAVLIVLKVDAKEIIERVSRLMSAPGRMEVFGGQQEPLVVVDYAHTPDALEKVLQTLLEHCEGELVAVFGCGGDRDAAKRPAMGAIASRLANRIIITNDNPRTESPDSIAEEIRAGVVEDTVVSTTLDRRRAIAEAIRSSKAGDCVLVAGKGHEQEQVIGSDVRAFDDREVVRSILSERAA